MLANNRTEILIGLKIKEINSIGTNKGHSITETPDGKNKENNLNLCIIAAMMCTPKNMTKLNENVIIN
jgi:hypothetical protein